MKAVLALVAMRAVRWMPEGLSKHTPGPDAYDVMSSLSSFHGLGHGGVTMAGRPSSPESHHSIPGPGTYHPEASYAALLPQKTCHLGRPSSAPPRTGRFPNTGHTMVFRTPDDIATKKTGFTFGRRLNPTWKSDVTSKAPGPGMWSVECLLI
jgi:hypothetical protein